MNNKIIVLGDGLLAKEIVNQTKWHYISRSKDGIDLTDISTYAGHLKNYDIIVNCIANTDTYSKDRNAMFSVNYKAVANLADFCEVIEKKKLVHFSTDFVYANSDQPATEETIPIPADNWYSHYKLMADEHIQMMMSNYLILRGSFKKNPFPYDDAFANITGNFLYVNQFAKFSIELIKKKAQGVYNVGSKEPYNMHQFALITKPDVRSVISWIDDSMPENVVMNTNKMWNLLERK